MLFALSSMGVAVFSKGLSPSHSRMSAVHQYTRCSRRSAAAALCDLCVPRNGFCGGYGPAVGDVATTYPLCGLWGMWPSRSAAALSTEPRPSVVWRAEYKRRGGDNGLTLRGGAKTCPLPCHFDPIPGTDSQAFARSLSFKTLWQTLRSQAVTLRLSAHTPARYH